MAEAEEAEIFRRQRAAEIRRNFLKYKKIKDKKRKGHNKKERKRLKERLENKQKLAMIRDTYGKRNYNGVTGPIPGGPKPWNSNYWDYKDKQNYIKELKDWGKGISK